MATMSGTGYFGIFGLCFGLGSVVGDGGSYKFETGKRSMKGLPTKIRPALITLSGLWGWDAN